MAHPAVESYSVQMDEESQMSMSGCSDSSSEEMADSSRRSRAAMIGAVGVIGAVVLCIGAFVDASTHNTITARELLESPETVDVLTKNIMALDQRMDEWSLTRAQIEKASREVMTQFRNEQPNKYADLAHIEVSPEQRRAVLRHLESVGDSRVRSVGQDIADAIKEILREKGDHEALKRRIVSKLGPRMDEVRQLRDAYFPGKSGGPLDCAALEPQHLDSMPLIHHFDEWRAAFDAEPAAVRQLQAVVDTTTASSSMMGKMLAYFKHMMANFREMIHNVSPFNNEVSAEYSNGAPGFMSCIGTAMTDSTSDVSTCFTEFMASLSSHNMR